MFFVFVAQTVTQRTPHCKRIKQSINNFSFAQGTALNALVLQNVILKSKNIHNKID